MTAAAAATLPRGTSPKLARIPLELIDTADNVRTSIDPAADAELADSIRALGILQPVTLWETPLGRYQVRYGHRRVRAARLAGLAEVPAIVSEDAALETRVTEQLVENLQRSDLSALEEAKALRAILDAEKGLTQAALAQRIGRSAPWVANTLGLLKLPAEVQQLLADGKLEASHGKAIAGLPASDQVSLARNAVGSGWSAHTLEEQAKYARSRKEDLAKRAKASVATAERAIATLTAAGTPKDVPLYVRAGWQVDNEQVKAAVAAAGWQVQDGWSYGIVAGCDCPALQLEVMDGTGGTITPTCTSEAHRTAAEAQARVARDLAAKERQAEAEQLRAAIATALEREPLHPTIARLVLRRLDGYSAAPWGDYAKKPEAEVLADVANRLIPPSYESGGTLPAKTVLKALGAEAGA